MLMPLGQLKSHCEERSDEVMDTRRVQSTDVY